MTIRIKLWTPSNFIIKPKAILDPSVASWSGSNWGSTANIGTGGGSINVSTGTPVKGTQLNGFDTVNFNANSLRLDSQSWAAGDDVVVLAVFNVTDAINGNAIAAQGWDTGTATSGWVNYVRANVASSINGDPTATWVIGDGLMFSAGFGDGGGTNGYQIITQPPMIDSLYHIMAWRGGNKQYYSIDGTLITAARSTTGSPAASGQPIFFGESNGSGVFGENLTGTVAYVAIIPGNVTTSEYQKFEGWAAWKYGLVSKLPGGHPYKLAAPLAPDIMRGAVWM